MLDRTIEPAIKNAIAYDFHLPSVQHDQLDNGIDLYWLKAGAQEVVQLELVFKAGLWFEKQTGVAQTTASLLKNGTLTKNAEAINEAIEFYGASLKVSANNDYAILTLSTLSKHLKQVLPIVLEVITAAQFPESELEIYKQNAIQRLTVNLLRGDFVSNRLIDAQMFGQHHPYGRYTEIADINALTTTALRAFHATHYTPENCTIFFAGQFTDQDLAIVKDMFGGQNWSRGASETHAEWTAESSTTLKTRVENDPKSVQGAIRLAKAIPNREHPDFAPSIVMNTIFGGYFGSRLMSNIREDKGYTYGIYSQFYAYKQEAMMLIATEAGKDVAELAVAEVFKEMKIMQEELVDEDELLLVKNYLLGNLLGDLDGPFSIMSRWKSLILNNMTIDNFNNNIQIYKDITATDVQRLAQSYLTADKFYDLIVY